MSETGKEHWLHIGGKPADDLELRAEGQVARRLADKQYTSEEIYYISKVDLRPIKGELAISDVKLEKLRRLCQAWEIDLAPQPISSHRKFIGPFIVAAKKIAFPIIRAALKDTIRQQKDFNAAAISLLSEVCNEKRGE